MSWENVDILYSRMREVCAKARLKFGRSLTLSEKILVTHSIDFDSQRWERGKAMLSLRPDRVAMQDATAQMAMLQFMQAGKDQTTLPSSIHCDHLIQGRDNAADDLSRGLIENGEVFAFLSSAAKKYGIDCWKPGSGIIHQVILENYAFPGGLIIGTDSHTPNAGGLGMMAIGVGGADAGEVMAGLPWEVLQPKLIGVKLTGKLNHWASAKDVILYLCGRLTVQGGTNKIIEYFGEGVESISCTGKATITNMGAEVGATCSIFPFDNRMASYLNHTGREALTKLAEQNIDCLVADPDVLLHPESYFDELIEIDLSTIEPQVVGPHTPDLARSIGSLKQEAEDKGFPLSIGAALIGSCTNSSYEDLSRVLNIARQGLDAGLKLKASLFISPGSELVYHTIDRDGFLDVFRALGATILANACGPCIGQWVRPNMPDHIDSIMTSFNRNFPGRNDGRPTTNAFIASPEIVMAMAFGGSLDFNPITDYLITPTGEKFKFAPPSGDDIPTLGYKYASCGLQKPVSNSQDVLIELSPDSERLSLLMPFERWDGNDYEDLIVLIKTKGKTTTDHISPAGPWLKYRGHLDKISDNMFLGATNALTDEIGHGTNVITKETNLTIAQIARHYQSIGMNSIVVGDRNYGEGSSREHAAMSPRYLGVKVVLARSFARIHETNLKKQGIIPLVFANAEDWELIEANDRITIRNLNSLSCDQPVEVIIQKRDTGQVLSILTVHTLTDEQIKWFKAGSALNALNN